MYLHLGQNTIVHESEILGIFDLDITSQSYRTRQYLNRAERNGEVVSISEELPKSFVVCAQPETRRSISPSSPARRCCAGGRRESRPIEFVSNHPCLEPARKFRRFWKEENFNYGRRFIGKWHRGQR